MQKIIFSIIFSLLISSGIAQNAIIKGKVYDAINNEAIPFATIAIQGTTTATQSDLDGNFILNNLVPGLYNLEIMFVGYKKKVVYELQITNVKPFIVNVALEADIKNLKEIEIKASPYNKTEESPVSLRTIGTSEIERNPGGNRDISKVIQSLPGVSSSAAFRNDIIIRGGAPNENRFYLDGIEVPNINHFSTQGSSGGPVGMINVNFIREVDFYSGAFPANRGNTLSSLFEFKQKDGNPDRIITNLTVGSSDYGLTLDGPAGKNASFIFSVRRSYLQLLFTALKLPFLPIYNDAQFKYKIRMGAKDEITIIGLGAIDNFKLNLKANETEQQKYLLENLPVNEQWSYTSGINYKHYREKGFTTFVVSRNHLNNTSTKYFNNDDSNLANLILKYRSQEIENKFRFENTIRNKGFKINYGINYEYATYTNNTFNKIALASGNVTIDYKSTLNFNKYGLFTQISKGFANERLILSLGLRSDANDYSNAMNDLAKQISPRFSLSYSFAPNFSFNANTGRYYQLPAYTVMGYRNTNGDLVNRYNNIQYISVDHIVSGFEYNGKNNSKITVEGFYKNYSKYPFLLNDSISLANLGSDFGVIGNAPANSTSKGKSYGAEFLLQQKLYKGFYGIIAYTLVRSEFTDKTGSYKPSAWDNKHIITLTGGKKFKKNWELGAKWRFLGGTPYTPNNVVLSSQIAVWDITGAAIPDYSLLNTQRLKSFHNLDIRLDKKIFLKKMNLNFYLDIQNAYGFKAQQKPILLVERDANGNKMIDPNNSTSYLVKEIPNPTGTTVPSIGIIIEF